MNDESENEKRPGFFGRLKAGLSLTRSRLTGSIEDLVLGEKAVDDALLEDIEAALLSADVGVSTTAEIVDNMTKRLERAELWTVRLSTRVSARSFLQFFHRVRCRWMSIGRRPLSF